jgi:hypothetical protein
VHVGIPAAAQLTSGAASTPVDFGKVVWPFVVVVRKVGFLGEEETPSRKGSSRTVRPLAFLTSMPLPRSEHR